MRPRRQIAALLLAILSCACGEDSPEPGGARELYAPEAPGPANLLLVSVDTLRADHLGAYGYARPTSPNLDRLATEGVLFEEAWAQSPWTLPSHASLLSGRYTRGHGMRDDHHRLPDGVPVVSELLSRAGYRTGAIVNTHHLLRSTNLLRDLDLFEYFPFENERGERTLSLERSVDLALRFLDGDDPRPFFLLLHTYDVHSDYVPAERYREQLVRPYEGALDGSTATLLRIRRGYLEPDVADVRHLVDLYDAAIRQMDDHLGRLLGFLDESGLGAQTLLIVTSDHGEEFLEHGGVLHGRTLHEEMLHVPLIVRGPGVPRGVRVSTPVALVDVMPTLLRAAGVDPPPDVDGRDLSPLWAGPRGPGTRPVFAEVDTRKLSRNPAPNLTAVRRGDLKLVYDREQQTSHLYDLVSDPGERTDLAPARPEPTRRLEQRVREHVAREGTRPLELRVPSEQRDLLERLGYLD